MAFSGLFGKKKSKGPEERDRGSSDALRSDVGTNSATDTGMRSKRGPNTRSPPVLSPRDVARQTAEKIDLIESQIESEIMASRTDHFVVSRPSHSSDSQRPMRSSPGSTDLLLGDSHLAHSMVLADSLNPVLEEAAILYANGQDLPAVSVLAEAIGHDRTPETWLMLLELYQSLGKRVEFEQLAIDYAVQFETSAPAWIDMQARRPAVAKPAPAARAAIAFQGTLDARIIPQLEQLRTLAQRNPVLHLEFDKVTSIDKVGADLMLRVLAAFQKSKHEVAISGAGVLAQKLQNAIAVGRRDEPNTVWMLLLEIYRILGRQAAFEETSIDYCVTYEVSPPSWEPASPKYRIEDADNAPAFDESESAGDVEAPLPDNGIALSGDVLGKADAEMQRLTEFAGTHDRIIIDCSRLVRVDFTAAGLLLNWAVGMRGARKHIEFVRVGHLVGALFAVMGLHEVVLVERRA